MYNYISERVFFVNKKLIAFLLSLALLLTCCVFHTTAADVTEPNVFAGETLWSFDGSKVSQVPAGWEIERGGNSSFWYTSGSGSLSYDSTDKAVTVKGGSFDGILYFPEIAGDPSNFIFEVTFEHVTKNSSMGLAQNIVLGSNDSDGDGLKSPDAVTWFAIYEKNSSTDFGYYIRKGTTSMKKTMLDQPEGFLRAEDQASATYKMVVYNGVTYIYANGYLLGSYTDSTTASQTSIRVGMFINNNTIDIKSAKVSAIDGSAIIWDGITTTKPTADRDGDGYTDISTPFELAWVINNGGAADGKWELLNDIWLNDMLVSVSDGTPTVTKRDGTVITDLSTLNTWYAGKTVKGDFKGNGNVVNGIFYDSYSETVSTNTRALFPTAGAGLKVSGFGVENSYITSNASYATAAIVGKSWDVSCTIDSCYAGESVYMYGDNLAGILGGGFATNSTVKMTNCYTLATLKHHDDNPKDSYNSYVVNGLIGNNWSWGSDDVITNCYAVGDTGLVRSGTTTNCAFVAPSNVEKITDIAAAYNLRTLAEAFVTTEGYPTLKIFLNEIDETKNIPLTGGFAGGSGTEADPYIIENGAQLRLCVGIFGDGKYYKLANNIAVNDISKINWNTGAVQEGYEPVVWFGSKSDADGAKYKGFAASESTFSGYIDGNGYVVSGLYYRPFSGYDKVAYGFYSTCAGLIPTFETGYVKNLVMQNCYLSTGRFAGAITSRTLGYVLIENVAIDSSVQLVANNAGSINAGSNYGSAAIGGMIGYVRNKNNTTIKNSGFAGNIKTNGNGNCWGLVGTIYNSSYTIENSFSVDIAPMCSSTKGVHGNARNITLKNVYSTIAPSSWVTDSVGTINGTVTVVPSVTGADALSASNMANVDKTVWYAVKAEGKAPMLRSYGTRIGDVDENGVGNEVDDTHALRATLIGAESYMNTDYNDDDNSNVLDLVAMSLKLKIKNDDWRSHPEDYKLLALTFDDGPDDYDPSVTMQVADVLAENNGSGTFFFIGKSFNKETDVDVANYVKDLGNEIGNHSYNHMKATDMAELSEEDFAKEFEGANELIKEKTGVTPKYWRGAGYAYSEQVYAHLEEIGMYAIGCHTSLGSDYSGGTATVDGIVNVLLSGLPDGAIVGGHSSSNTYVTPQALAIALPQLYEQGYRFCTVSELMEYRNVNEELLPEHAYITRIETLSDGSCKIHTSKRLYLDNWKENPEDYKLLAFTFDDGPRIAKDNRMVELFAKYKGSATMFVTGTACNSSGFESLQNAINNGWDIGNHSMTHADAWSGSGDNYTELTYDELKYQICDMNTLLETNLTMADGVTPYEVVLYRPPQIRTTDTLFQICEEENMPVIWLSQNTYDWSSAYDYDARLKVLQDGVGTWIDGDVILGHITQDSTYNVLVETLDAYYDAGYRFCSITELMEYRGVSRESISGKLNDVDGNQGRVRNIIKSATYGKAED